MGTVSPSKFMSLSYLRNLSDSWYTGKNGKEYDMQEVLDLLWEKEANTRHAIREDIPRHYRIENLECNELDSIIKSLQIFRDEIDG